MCENGRCLFKLDLVFAGLFFILQRENVSLQNQLLLCESNFPKQEIVKLGGKKVHQVLLQALQKI